MVLLTIQNQPSNLHENNNHINLVDLLAVLDSLI
jgi:hypothetical protein